MRRGGDFLGAELPDAPQVAGVLAEEPATVRALVRLVDRGQFLPAGVSATIESVTEMLVPNRTLALGLWAGARSALDADRADSTIYDGLEEDALCGQGSEVRATRPSGTATAPPSR